MLVKVLLNLFYRVASVCQVHENKKLSFKNTQEKYNSHSFPNLFYQKETRICIFKNKHKLSPD